MTETGPKWKEQFDYLEDDNLPALVLGISIHWSYPKLYKPKPDGFKWQNIVHQTAGHACHQHYIQGVILPVTAEVWKAMRLLADAYEDSQVWHPASLETANEYRAKLRSLFSNAIDCNDSHSELEEAIYPIDCTSESLRSLTTAKLPSDLDSLIDWESEIDRWSGIVGRWRLYVLGDNSD